MSGLSTMLAASLAGFVGQPAQPMDVGPGADSQLVDDGPGSVAARAVTLRELLQRANSDASAVLAAEARLGAREAEERTTRASLWPTIELGLSGRYLTGQEQASFGDLDNVAFGRLDASAALVYRANIGSGVHRNRSSEKRREAAALDVESARLRAFRSTVEAHHDLALTAAALGIAEQLEQDSRRFARITQVRFEAQIASEADAARAATEHARARYAVLHARANWEQASVTLSTLMRWEPGERLVVGAGDTQARPVPSLADLKALRASAIVSRPELRATSRRAAAAERRERAEKWDLWGPELVLEVRERVLGSAFDNLAPATVARALIGWRFGLEGLGRRDEARADVRLQRTLEEAQQHEVRGEVETAVVRVRASKEAIPIAEEALAAATRNHAIQLARFEAGTALGLEVIEAQTVVAQARLTLSAAALTHDLEQLRLLAALGELGPGVVPAGE